MSAEKALPPAGLDQEIQVFTRFLVQRDPNEYVNRKYHDGHRSIPFARDAAADPVDVVLVMFARRGPPFVRMADAYARIFRPQGILRQKLTLLLAILEHTPPIYPELTSGTRDGSFPGALLRIGASLLGFAVSLMAGMLIIGPVHALLRLRTAPRVPAP